MGNREPGEFLLQKQDTAAWERACSAARPAVCDLDMPGIGERRLQLIVCSSFEYDEEPAWEVRQLQQEWWLFRSDVVESWPNVELVEYRPIVLEAAVLSSFFSRVTALSLSIRPDLETDGLDGEIWQLAVFGQMESACRFQWWSASPAQWKPLADLAAEMRDAFTAAESRSS
jgi:hypothetical protein